MAEEFQLTRRDALAALTAGGLAAGVGVEQLADDARDAAGPPDDRPAGESRLGENVRDTLVGVAHVVYPSAVNGVDAFVRTFIDGRTSRRPTHTDAIAATVAELNAQGEDWYGEPFTRLDRATQARLLREVGADTAEAVPTGTTAERVRYYLVNEVLFALYASPTGAELVGLENPQGHPGGLSSYQRGPQG